ncbi:hypothetical protein MIC448_2190003 [Microbacterium sp. C448]|nr:hypothetical protein MIC448_2190003 [Microbacterium sp. C448]
MWVAAQASWVWINDFHIVRISHGFLERPMFRADNVRRDGS